VKTSTRVKTINGIEYIYEISYYYDKETKRTRQKSKYLGKNINGTPVKVRDQTKSPKSAYSLGEHLPYWQGSLELEFEILLRKYLTPTETKIVLGIAYSGLTRLNALYNPSGWYEGTAMHLRTPNLKFHPQAIERVLHKIGSSQIPQQFCLSFARCLETKRAFAYDISINNTDFGTINKKLHNDLLTSIEPEYENISLIYDADKRLPIFYQSYNQPSPGMPSSKEVLAAIRALSISAKDALLIQDRNSYTPMNMYELYSSNAAYMLPIPIDAPEISNVEKQNQTVLMHPKNLNIYSNSSVFVVPFSTLLDTAPTKGYFYYSPQKDETEQKRIYENVSQICDHLDQSRLHSWMSPADTVKEIAGEYERFIGWKVEEGGKLNVSVKTKSISKYAKKLGKFAIVYSGHELRWDECLTYYDAYAADQQIMTKLLKRKEVFSYGIRTKAITQGLLFVSFLSLVLNRWFLNRMEHSGILSLYNEDKIVIELEKIKLIEFSGRKVTTTDLNRRQKEILAAMRLQIEY
jgi:hypothetical protein